MIAAGNSSCLLLASTLIIALIVPGFLGGFLTVNDCRTTVRSIHIIWACHLMGDCLAHGISSTGDWTTAKSLKSMVHAKHRKIFLFLL